MLATTLRMLDNRPAQDLGNRSHLCPELEMLPASVSALPPHQQGARPEQGQPIHLVDQHRHLDLLLVR